MRSLAKIWSRFQFVPGTVVRFCGQNAFSKEKREYLCVCSACFRWLAQFTNKNVLLKMFKLSSIYWEHYKYADTKNNSLQNVSPCNVHHIFTFIHKYRQSGMEAFECTHNNFQLPIILPVFTSSWWDSTTAVLVGMYSGYIVQLCSADAFHGTVRTRTWHFKTPLRRRHGIPPDNRNTSRTRADPPNLKTWRFRRDYAMFRVTCV